jgi:CysZ protein
VVSISVRTPSDFARGAGHGVRGARLVLGSPRLWPLVLLPFVLSLIAFVAIFAAAFALRERWLALLPDAGALRALLGAVAYLALLVVGFFAYLPVATLIAAPFNESIAEAVEQRLAGSQPPPFSLARLLRDLARGLGHAIRSLSRYLVLAAAVFAASFIPVVGPFIALIGGGYVAARFAAYDALDATLSRWGWSYARKQRLLRERRALCMGLGVLVAVLLAIPVLGAVALPLGAAGGASLALAAVPAAERGGAIPAAR